MTGEAYTLSDVHLIMQMMLLLWIWLVARVVRRMNAEGSVGLPAALLLTLSFLYGGCFVYAVPGYTHLRADGNLYLMSYQFSEWTVVQGTFASLLGVAGFAVGTGSFARSRRQPLRFYYAPHPRDRQVLLVLGGLGLMGFAIHYLRIQFPMSNALNEAARNVAVVAICLGAYMARQQGKSIALWAGLAALVPLYYIALFGFVSYGFLFGIALVAFWIAQLRRQSSFSGFYMAILSAGGIWILLTGFVAWFSFRNEIRRILWDGGEGSVFAVIGQALSETKLFSLANYASLDMVNIRLDLPIFIGRMIEQHQALPDLTQYGATLIVLPLILVPRALWPGKPERGGSDFMETHTGIPLSDGTTFGTGTVFEFYVNFGYIGVLLGFIVFGWIIRRLDRAAYRALAEGRLFDFAQLFVVGIVALDPLQRPFFVANGAVFAWLLMWAVKLALKRQLKPPKHRIIRPQGQVT